nr:coiled-coil-helix-coiled-coil-helix domain-containing protein 5 [Hydra vulgaris]
MDQNIALIEKQCRKQIQVFTKCVELNEDTWQTVCLTEKENLTKCSSENPMIQLINKNCKNEFRKYDSCIRDNGSQLYNCMESLEQFNTCAARTVNGFGSSGYFKN